MLKKSDIPDPPQLKSEVVPVPELGGDVMLRGIYLADLIRLAAMVGHARICGLLAVSVLVQDDETGEYVPRFDAEEWERWGAKHAPAAMMLWNKASKLSGLDSVENEKKPVAQTSD